MKGQEGEPCEAILRRSSTGGNPHPEGSIADKMKITIKSVVDYTTRSGYMTSLQHQVVYILL